ncbi:unannotated protein [freshwater metagenome]|uniref:Unannotated protein n=1 Tax=freshwater metagenome TaxID=449393 RepID=A0A6J7EUG1_9ZZZZ
MLCRLHDEWHHISIRSSELRTVRTWGLPGLPVQSLDEVLARCGYRPAPGAGQAPPVAATATATATTAGTPDHYEDYLLQVMYLARAEPLAARIVLQRILPALVAVANRHAASHTDRHAMLDELVANAWPIIRRYPCERRPRHIVPNLVRDTSFETFVRPVRRKSSGEVPMTHDQLDRPTHEPVIGALEELVAVLHEARRLGLAQADIDLLAQIVTMGRPEEVALVLEVTPRTVRNHRDAIVHRLRNIVREAA